MNRAAIYRQEILTALERRATGPAHRGDRYSGSTKWVYPVSVPLARTIAREWIAGHPELTPGDYRRLLNLLARGQSVNEFGFLGDLLHLLPALRATLRPRDLEEWLNRAEGWAEVDSICQSKFTAAEMLSRWRAWKEMLTAFSRSENVHQRRASLVLLTHPVRHCPDPRLSKLAFANLRRLQSENDILITKAVSWLLRELIVHHRAEVEQYLEGYADALPRVAVRETRVKLATGVKTLRARRSAAA